MNYQITLTGNKSTGEIRIAIDKSEYDIMPSPILVKRGDIIKVTKSISGLDSVADMVSTTSECESTLNKYMEDINSPVRFDLAKGSYGHSVDDAFMYQHPGEYKPEKKYLKI